MAEKPLPRYRLLSNEGHRGMEKKINNLAEQGYRPMMMSAKGDFQKIFVLMVLRAPPRPRKEIE
jgi:hypothetical protein